MTSIAIVLRAGGEARPVEVEIRNTGDSPVRFVGVVDGSEHGLRYPHYRPSITCGGVLVATPEPAEDPLVGPLREQDFRLLAPGESFDPAGEGFLPLVTFAWRPDGPGVYRYALEVSTESESPQDWLGRFGQDPSVIPLIAEVPRLTVAGDLVVRL
ncbi:hypothetical protein Lesp02_80440 [Lentzea sp. NBRC 105346]|uniref:hypothetical protein n=1 Tax=Lentzea sp. NBRC 105346 TaxID=3032205 RepID=UPI0024A39B09|nr:hypothetical protein [Lentzea sp. NBRC 105346]GLZ35857.1 hypothetical protein Lesp02_80440 [Lentzea sp. NBRC 105346]